MTRMPFVTALALLAGSMAAAQQPAPVELRIEPANRTLTVTGQGLITVDPDLAILHIGFQTLPADAKAAYAGGAEISNRIISALTQAGIPETGIHSEWQRLDSVYGKPHKFTLSQQWTVKTPPERAAEILDVAVSAGATQSGDIDWTVQDKQALADKALDAAAARARSNAEALAKGMGVHLGALIYVTNEVSAPQFPMMSYAEKAAPEEAAMAAPPLAIEPHQVSRSATVYVVYSIE